MILSLVEEVEMKKVVRVVAAITLAGVLLSASSCLIFERKRLPPGHAKKTEQDQSAKKYAPGHKK
jgi:hypothetical protein